MKLMTKEIEEKLPKLYETESIPTEDKIAVAKFFAPTSNWTWFAVEGTRQPDGDWLFFGYVIGHEKEWGYFTLRELESVKLPFGLGIERDIFFDPQPIKPILQGGH